ncbi:hypothetical protein C8J55DRAFT_562021 [Lentinula edodes]|uniref:Uncharacterized protein n=1 Tax=Lentinula lateritia TaxID=40482 RepID=A0A9W9A7U6_9AGAR|nr:hypothetical protein C8J55DRAFT_562021 [Lentinula edodes]
MKSSQTSRDPTKMEVYLNTLIADTAQYRSQLNATSRVIIVDESRMTMGIANAFKSTNEPLGVSVGLHPKDQSIIALAVFDAQNKCLVIEFSTQLGLRNNTIGQLGGHPSSPNFDASKYGHWADASTSLIMVENYTAFFGSTLQTVKLGLVLAWTDALERYLLAMTSSSAKNWRSWGSIRQEGDDDLTLSTIAMRELKFRVWAQGLKWVVPWVRSGRARTSGTAARNSNIPQSSVGQADAELLSSMESEREEMQLQTMLAVLQTFQ